MSLNILETQLHMVLDKLSNGQPVEYEESWIEEAGEMFKDTLRKQLGPREDKFRIRMSNVGRPLCQLQQEKAGTPKSKNPYNNIVRFMLGDATEVLVELYLKLAKINITGGKDKVELEVGDTTIRGENDVEIDNKVYDTKSSSPWAYENKWSTGWEGVAKDDAFGYIPQLLGYSDASDKEPGGWIVVNKSTGEIQVVDAEFSDQDKENIRKKIRTNVDLIATDAPFKRCFEPQDEYFRKQLTPNKRLAMNCTFCNYTNTCWPDAKYRPQTGSKAQSPRHYWYAEYEDE
jgi:hypothetical protein